MLFSDEHLQNHGNVECTEIFFCCCQFSFPLKAEKFSSSRPLKLDAELSIFWNSRDRDSKGSLVNAQMSKKNHFDFKRYVNSQCRVTHLRRFLPVSLGYSCSLFMHCCWEFTWFIISVLNLFPEGQTCIVSLLREGCNYSKSNACGP